MDTEELIRENAELRRRLMHAERWMRREVGSARMNRKKEEITQHARSYFHNIFEETGLDII